jgi:hypothetical protein
VVGQESGVAGWEVEGKVGGPHVAAKGGGDSLLPMEDQLAQDLVVL